MKEKDMHMPAWLCVLGCVLLAGALACLVLCFVVSVYALIGFALCLCLGVAAILCYKNQWVEMIIAPCSATKQNTIFPILKA